MDGFSFEKNPPMKKSIGSFLRKYLESILTIFAGYALLLFIVFVCNLFPLVARPMFNLLSRIDYDSIPLQMFVLFFPFVAAIFVAVIWTRLEKSGQAGAVELSKRLQKFIALGVSGIMVISACIIYMNVFRQSTSIASGNMALAEGGTSWIIGILKSRPAFSKVLASAPIFITALLLLFKKTRATGSGLSLLFVIGVLVYTGMFLSFFLFLPFSLFMIPATLLLLTKRDRDSSGGRNPLRVRA